MNDKQAISEYWESKRAQENKSTARIRAEKASKARGGKRCSSCGLYGCVCQASLPEWELEDKLKKSNYMERRYLIRKWNKEANK